MKRTILALATLALFFPAAPRAEADADVSIDFFYNNLGDDGSWIEVGDYGYCWQPNVAVSNSNWRPYSDGYWAYTDVGWTWVSYEDFGWATYHYGRWARLRDQGWVWVPGQEWGPAWVSWRTGGDYVGWAPLPPRYASGGGEVVYDGRPITGRVDIDFDIGPSYYNFVDVRYIGEPVLRERIFAPTENVTYINRTVNVTNITFANSVVYNHGPDYNTLSAYSTRPIRRMRLDRQTNVDFGAVARSGGLTRVEGDELVVAAPQRIERGPQTLAPKRVKPRIAKANLETGWMGISDPKAKAELQQKIKTEDLKSVPPPQLAPTNPAALTAASPGTPPAGASATPPAATSPATGLPLPPAGTSPAALVTPSVAPTQAPKAPSGLRQLGQSPAPSASASPAISRDELKGRGKDKDVLTRPSAPTATPQTGLSTPAATATPVIQDEQLKQKGEGKNRRRPNEPLSPTAVPQTDATPGATAAPSASIGESRGGGRRAIQPIPTIAPTAPPTVESGSPELGAGNSKPERKVSAPNPPDGPGRRTTNGLQEKVPPPDVQRPEGAVGTDAPQTVPQNPPPPPAGRQIRTAPIAPQVAPPQGGPGNGQAGAVREGQSRGAKGKKEKKDEQAPSPAPEQ